MIKQKENGLFIINIAENIMDVDWINVQRIKIKNTIYMTIWNASKVSEIPFILEEVTDLEKLYKWVSENITIVGTVNNNNMGSFFTQKFI